MFLKLRATKYERFSHKPEFHSINHVYSTSLTCQLFLMNHSLLTLINLSAISILLILRHEFHVSVVKCTVDFIAQ